MDHFHNIVFSLPATAPMTPMTTTTTITPIPDIKGNLDELNAIKSLITNVDAKSWDFLKKKNNPFECVTTNGGLANYTPISRAYFKMTEILHLFREPLAKAIGWSSQAEAQAEAQAHFTTLHLAEGPGGFMECLDNTLSDMRIPSFQYDMYGITLMKEDSKSVPSWKKTAYFLEQHPHMHILTGRDGTGDLYNIDNIFATAVEMATGQKASVITGDGGFDFSTDFNQQESMSFPLLYCQAMTALLCQKPGGMFVLKFFDTYQTKTLQLLCLLRRCYRQLSFVKPYTSRPANSEKYLVCVDFRNNITVKDIVVFLQDIPKIGSSPAHHPRLALSKETTADTAFYAAIDQMNKCLFARQKEFILSTLQLEKTLDDHRKEALFKQQIYTSTQWCHRYGMKLNYQSKYLSNYSSSSCTSNSQNEPRAH